MPKFRLPAIPSWDCDSPVEIADWWEIESTRAQSRSASLNALRAGVAREAETDPATDAEADIDEESRFDYAINEVKYRINVCTAAAYPFRFSENSERVLTVVQPLGGDGGQSWWLYMFLLLTTRLNMNTRREFAGVDGTLLFEEVCEVALMTFGGAKLKSHRFGTSKSQGNFPAKLRAFFADLKEFDLREDREIPNHGGDDGLDIGMWNTFNWGGETKPPQGKLILLAQCKTGTSWEKADMQRLQPDTFFDKWMAHSPLGATARAFMTSSRVDAREWEDCHREGGLFFDRCRIVDYAAGRLPTEMFSRLRSWTAGAIACEDLGVR